MAEPIATLRAGFLRGRLPRQLREFCRNWKALSVLVFLVFFVAILAATWGILRPRHHITLRQAADRGDLREVKWLLDHGEDVNARECEETPLIVAAGRGNVEIARYLVSRGADVNAGRESGRSALMQAICNHHPKLAIWLMDQGADVNVKAVNGDSVLHCAARYGNAEIAHELIQRGAALNKQTEGGRTPLYTTLVYRANMLKDISVAETLLRHGADPNIGVTNDCAFGPGVKSPLQLAVFLKFPALEELLTKYGAKY